MKKDYFILLLYNNVEQMFNNTLNCTPCSEIDIDKVLLCKSTPWHFLVSKAILFPLEGCMSFFNKRNVTRKFNTCTQLWQILI